MHEIEVELALATSNGDEDLGTILMPCSPFVGMHVQLSNEKIYIVEQVKWIVVSPVPYGMLKGYFKCVVSC